MNMLLSFMEAKDILVIGGGVAGLAAALELARAGKPVLVLEANHRLGGRIFTQHSGRTPIELGAEFIHGGSDSFWKAVRAGRLKTFKVPNRFQRFENGAFRKLDLWSEVEKVMKQIDPDAPDESFARFLAKQKHSKSTKQLVTHFVEGFDAADPRKIGIHGLAAGDEEENPGEHQFRIRRGYSALVDWLERTAKNLGVKIKKNTVVKTVRWKTGNVRVIARQKGKPTAFEGQAAVIALPLGVLKNGRVRFEPPLRDKQRAIDRLQFGNVLKVILKFKRVFWKPRNFGFIMAPDESIPTWWSDDRGIVLTGWVGGPGADERRSISRLKSEALRIVAKIFNVTPAFLKQQLVEMRTHDWRKDKFIGGAYSYVPVNGVNLPKSLAASVQHTLFFAGEATASTTQPGTVHGALDSGLRAAKEILAAI
jgi:monoamine oxidase